MITHSISSKGVNEIVLQSVIDQAKKLNKDKISILEIGPGKGALSKAIRDALEEAGIKYEIECGDIEPQQINDQKLGFECRYVDAQDKFNLNKNYDIGIIVELIEHIENPFHLIREFSGILKPGSMLIVTSPNILSLASRLRFFFTGCYDYFRRPYNEYWLNMGHVNPINPLQLMYVLRKNGFEDINVTTNKGTLNSILLLPFAALIYLFSFMHYILRENREGGKEQKSRNRKTLHTLMSPGMLLGKIAIYKAIRTSEIQTNTSTWFQSDKHFKP